MTCVGAGGEDTALLGGEDAGGDCFLFWLFPAFFLVGVPGGALLAMWSTSTANAALCCLSFIFFLVWLMVPRSFDLRLPQERPFAFAKWPAFLQIQLFASRLTGLSLGSSLGCL